MGWFLGNRVLPVLGVLACVLALAGPAAASKIIAGNAAETQLAVNTRGKALVTYRDGGRLRHLLAWGAIDARVRPATQDGPTQVKFRLDYSGGWGAFHRPVWKTFRNACRPYDGPALAWFVTACKAPDGSYWALQSWQTALPDLGFAPWLSRQGRWWLHLSHWRGPLAVLSVYRDWLSGDRFQEVFGQYTYRGAGVRGFGTTGRGAPTDGYGRLVYIDTRNSVYGAGWRRDASIVSTWATRDLLPRLRAGRSLRGLRAPEGHAASESRARDRRQIPDHRDGAGRHSRRDVAGPGARPLQPARSRGCPARAADEREARFDSRRVAQVH